MINVGAASRAITRRILGPIRRITHPLVRCGPIVVANGPHIGPHMVDAMLRGRYEEPELTLLERMLCPGDVVVELGGCLGVLAARAAQIAGEKGQVISFEPNPRMADAIRDTWQRNRVAPTLVEAAVGSKNGRITLCVGREAWAATTSVQKGGGNGIEVELRALADVVETYEPTVLIVDVEGGEAELFFDARELANIRAVLIELHPHVAGVDAQAVCQRISSAGLAERPGSTATVKVFERQVGWTRGA